MTNVLLATLDGAVEPYRLGTHPVVTPPSGKPRSRVAYAAAHIVADPLGDPVGASAIDWDTTLAFRRHLWSMGFGVAEAMDTAQRGMGLEPDDVRRLITLSITEAAAEGGVVACGITTDELAGPGHGLDAITGSYLEQLGFVENLGGTAVMMASRALAATAHSPEDYAAVYGKVLAQAGRPVVIHWLGPQFDPALAGYWGSDDPWQAMESLLAIIASSADHVDGVKVSMLDADLEIALRRSLPDGVLCYTGDDFNFPALIAGDDEGFSHALLGIFDGIAPVAAAALHALDAGALPEYHRLLAPTLPLSRHIFRTPTYHYKTGLTFLAYLAGHQDHFRMVAGHEGYRSIIHLSEIVRLADAAGLLPDPDDVARRLRPVLAAAGIDGA